MRVETISNLIQFVLASTDSHFRFVEQSPPLIIGVRRSWDY